MLYVVLLVVLFILFLVFVFVFFFKQKTAYEMRISDWSSDVCSSDLGETPVLAVRLQEMFGSAETPRIAGGRVPLTLHLLSPARRPVQVTRDLAGFWTSSYRMVKADLKGRYPKHHWPDDPLAAEPTARAKPRKA